MFKISRDKNEKTTTMLVDYEGPWKVFAGNSPEIINPGPILEGNERGSYLLDVPKTVRSYFRIEIPGQSLIVAERVLPMGRGYNFRDLGGYEAADGMRVRWGRLLRADEMNRLEESDLAYLESVPLRSVVDFRSENEQNYAPDRFPDSVSGCFSLSIRPGSLMDFTPEPGASPKNDGGSSMMKGMNIALVRNTEALEQYRIFFSLIQDEKNLPLLFHCSAGKDRTGMAAALFLSALGVDEETIMYDYLLSNILLEDKYAAEKQYSPEIRLMYEARAEFLQAGFVYLEKTYGSIENFLVEKFDFEIENLRELYLENPKTTDVSQ